MIIIRCEPETCGVTLNGHALSPAASQKLWNHSPDGFNWGYGGSGPAQLALAILLAVGVEPDRAVRLHQRFKADFVQSWPCGESFAAEIDVEGWLVNQETWLRSHFAAEV